MITAQDCALESRYNSDIVNIQTAASLDLSQLNELCERLKTLGYAESKRIRIYGEEFEVVSNPFPEGKGIAVRAQPAHKRETRILQLPLPILQMATKKTTAA